MSDRVPVYRLPRTHSVPAGRGRAARASLAVLGLVLALGLTAPAAAHHHDPHSSGHPLRLLAYVAHPVGVVIDTLVFRPAHWLGHHEPFRTLFGHDH